MGSSGIWVIFFYLLINVFLFNHSLLYQLDYSVSCKILQRNWSKEKMNKKQQEKLKRWGSVSKKLMNKNERVAM